MKRFTKISTLSWASAKTHRQYFYTSLYIFSFLLFLLSFSAVRRSKVKEKINYQNALKNMYRDLSRSVRQEHTLNWMVECKCILSTWLLNQLHPFKALSFRLSFRLVCVSSIWCASARLSHTFHHPQWNMPFVSVEAINICGVAIVENCWWFKWMCETNKIYDID